MTARPPYSAVPMSRELPIPVIDLFAGPGGLSEGFVRFGEKDWEVMLSVPKGRGRKG